MILKGDDGMELNDIKIFVELYNNLSISKTAEKLSYTQSNVSTRLMKLEEEFHTTFFNRTRYGLQALPCANQFYHYANTILDTLDELYSQFSMPNKQINIGATQLLSRLYFPSLYQRYRSYHFHTVTSNKLQRSFQNKEFDAIITHFELESSKDTYHLCKYEPLLWTKSTHSSIDGGEKLNIIMNRDKQCPLRAYTLETISKNHINASLVEVDTLDLMLSLLYSSNCIALLPKRLISLDKQLDTFTQLPDLTLNIYIYYRSNIEKNIFTDLLKD